MKKISYLDMVRELLSENDFLEFEKSYKNPVQKSVKIISNRGVNGGGNLHDIVKTLLFDSWNIVEPDFSFAGNKYNDVVYAEKKTGCSFSTLGSHWLHQAGLIYVQEIAASLSVQVLGVQKTDVVLDMCAAPGGKTIQIADKAKFVISNEVDSGRIKALKSNLHRCGIYNVGVIQNDGVKVGGMFPEIFDKVLVDAPCSGEGMQYKSDKKVWQWDESKSRRLAELQIQLVLSGFDALKVGGELVYSTCTTNPIENEYVVSEVLKKCGENIELIEVPLDQKSEGICNWRGSEILSLDNAKKVARLWPHIQGTGGFFMAKFKKNDSLGFGKKGVMLSDEQGVLVSSFEGQIRSGLSTRGIQPNSELDFFESKFTVNVAPKGLIDKHFERDALNIEVGLPIFKILEDRKLNSKKLVPLIGIAQAFGHLAIKNTLEINDEQLKSLMEKKDLNDDRLRIFEGEFVILKWNGAGVGLVSVQKGIGKNKCF